MKQCRESNQEFIVHIEVEHIDILCNVYLVVKCSYSAFSAVIYVVVPQMALSNLVLILFSLAIKVVFAAGNVRKTLQIVAVCDVAVRKQIVYIFVDIPYVFCYQIVVLFGDSNV